MRIIATTLFSIFLLSAAFSVQAQSKADKKTAKLILKVGTWEAHKLFSDGRPINIKAVVGEVYMDFKTKKETKTQTVTDKKGRDKKKKTTSIVNVFKMEMGGSDRIFNYEVESDSIKFIGLKGWNDYRIVRMSKDELVIEQILNNSLMRWVMVPSTREEE